MKAEQFKDIQRHGQNLLRLFPGGLVRDPIDLCKKLHRMEVKLHRMTTDYCNGSASFEDVQKAAAPITKMIGALLPGCEVWVNCDARGYALKFESNDQQVYKDWGQDAIIAPEF